MQVTIITGASQGIGEQFARQLAQRKHNLVLVARSRGKLEQLAEELSARNGIEATPLAVDLSEPNAAAQVAGFLTSRGMQPRWLINNAGFGHAGAFDTIDLDATNRMITLNIGALVELTHLLLPQLRLNREGAIINVASIAGFQPLPYMAVYGATKSFVLSFSEALAEELRVADVRVLALCPGPVSTNFAAAGGLNATTFEKGQSAEDVVARALSALERGRVVCVTQKAWAVSLQSLVPRFLLRRVAGIITKRMMLRRDDPHA